MRIKLNNSIIKGKWKQIKIRNKKCCDELCEYDHDHDQVHDQVQDHDIVDGDALNLSGLNLNNNYKFKGARVITICRDLTVSKEKADGTKELNFLHDFSCLLREENNNHERILEGTVKLLPSSFMYPEDAGVCITFRGREFKTPDYEPTPWKIISHLESCGEVTGSIEVCYSKQPLQRLDSFTKEERLVLETVAEHLSRVTEQIQAKEDLQRSKNKLSITLDSIGDGVIVTDVTERITRLNPQAEKLTGWSEKEALGRAFHEVFHIVNSKTGDPVPNPVKNVIKTVRTHGLAKDTILIARDGTKRHIADSAAPIRDYKDRIFNVIMVFSDVTERREAEESLKYQLEFEKMLAEVSNAFSVLPSDQIQLCIQHALKLIKEFFQVERSYFYQFSGEGNEINNSYELYEEGNIAKLDRIQNVSATALSWWVEQIKNKRYVNLMDLDSLSPEAQVVIDEFRSQVRTSIKK